MPTTTASSWSALMPAAGECLLCCRSRHVDDALVVGGEVARDDARALADPLVGGVDVLADLVVGHHPRRAVGADAEDAGVLQRQCVARALVAGRSRLNPRGGAVGRAVGRGRLGSPSSTSHSTMVPPWGATTVCSSRLVWTCPTAGSRLELVADAGVDCGGTSPWPGPRACATWGRCRAGLACRGGRPGRVRRRGRRGSSAPRPRRPAWLAWRARPRFRLAEPR